MQSFALRCHGDSRARAGVLRHKDTQRAVHKLLRCEIAVLVCNTITVVTRVSRVRVQALKGFKGSEALGFKGSEALGFKGLGFRIREAGVVARHGNPKLEPHNIL